MSITGPDFYHGNGALSVAGLKADPNVNFIIFKATEHTSGYVGEPWFRTYWPQFETGFSGARGSYHWLIFSASGAAQYRYHRHVVDAVGGWKTGDLWPIIDCEPADQTGTPSKSQILRCVAEFCAAAKADGISVICYGRVLFDTYGVSEADLTNAGVDFRWKAQYGPSSVPFSTDIWQYSDGAVNGTGFPSSFGGMSPSDGSVVELASLDTLVFGGTPRDSSGGGSSTAGGKRIRAFAKAPPGNPLSAQSLARNGKAQYLVDEVTISGPNPPSQLGKGKHSAAEIAKHARQEARYQRLFLARQKDAEDIAQRRLRRDLQLAQQVSFDALVVAELEEMDMVATQWDGGYVEHALEQYTIPLVASDGMAVGYTKTVDPRNRMRWRLNRDRPVRRSN